MIPRDQLVEIRLPSRCAVTLRRDDPDWVIEISVEAIDVETGGPGTFRTIWRGAEPSDSDVVMAICNALVHEVREQLGLDPHHAVKK